MKTVDEIQRELDDLFRRRYEAVLASSRLALGRAIRSKRLELESAQRAQRVAGAEFRSLVTDKEEPC